MKDWLLHTSVGGMGALLLEAARVAMYVQRAGHTPWRSRDHRGRTDVYGHPLPRRPIFILAVFLKSLTGMTVVGVLAASGQSGTLMTSLLLGASATDLIRRSTTHISLPDGTDPAANNSQPRDTGKVNLL